MKQYLKPILLSGLTPGDGGDPFTPPGGEGSVTGGTDTDNNTRALLIDEQRTFAPLEEIPIEFPVVDAPAVERPMEEFSVAESLPLFEG